MWQLLRGSKKIGKDSAAEIALLLPLCLTISRDLRLSTNDSWCHSQCGKCAKSCSGV